MVLGSLDDDHDGDVDDVVVAIDGAVLGEELRSAAVNRAVSPVSAVPAVREQLVALQRAVIGLGGVVAEGRDVGTVVWPQAEVKIFLTADAAERARRRGAGGTDGESAAALERRDRIDAGRATAPTRAAPDALVVDSTNRAADDVVAQVVALVAAARAGRPR